MTAFCFNLETDLTSLVVITPEYAYFRPGSCHTSRHCFHSWVCYSQEALSRLHLFSLVRVLLFFGLVHLCCPFTRGSLPIGLIGPDDASSWTAIMAKGQYVRRNLCDDICCMLEGRRYYQRDGGEASMASTPCNVLGIIIHVYLQHVLNVPRLWSHLRPCLQYYYLIHLKDPSPSRHMCSNWTSRLSATYYTPSRAVGVLCSPYLALKKWRGRRMGARDALGD